MSTDVSSLSLKINIICVSLVAIVLCFDLLVPLGVAGGVPYVAVILASLWHPKENATIFLAIVCSALTILGLYFSPSGGELWKVLFNRAIALFAIWITAVLCFKWKQHRNELFILNKKMEREKEIIYLATIHSAQHITNNLLNQLKLVERGIKRTPEIDKEISSRLANMLAEAKRLMEKLSSVEIIEEEAIKDSVHPKHDYKNNVQKGGSSENGEGISTF